LKESIINNKYLKDIDLTSKLKIKKDNKIEEEGYLIINEFLKKSKIESVHLGATGNHLSSRSIFYLKESLIKMSEIHLYYSNGFLIYNFRLFFQFY
jgi:hypothetical protein